MAPRCLLAGMGSLGWGAIWSGQYQLVRRYIGWWQTFRDDIQLLIHFWKPPIFKLFIHFENWRFILHFAAIRFFKANKGLIKDKTYTLIRIRTFDETILYFHPSLPPNFHVKIKCTKVKMIKIHQISSIVPKQKTDKELNLDWWWLLN